MSQAATPQIRLIGAVPRVVLARLQMFFNTNKTFLLPSALPAVQKLRQIYADNSPGKLLVVGHADTTAGGAYNDKLSLERAQATIAFLEDDFQTWLKFYDTGVDSKKRWGKVEDHLMIISMPDFDTKPKGQGAVSWYQSTRHLNVDGKAGTDTRTALIKEYMSLDGASLEDSGVEIEAVAHGCGENFPLDDSGKSLDAPPADNKRDAVDRRVELFFFDSDFGIVPAPPGANSGPKSTQYPAWRQRIEETVELTAGDVNGPKVTFVEMADAHFRTNSAVVMPEGEDPDNSGKQQAFTSVGVIATALRFNDEHPGRSLLIAGHTDTAADPDFNLPLSQERANVTLALLRGGPQGREDFKNLCNARHTVSDIKQILAWVSRTIPGISCNPGVIDDNAATATPHVVAFQKGYNATRATIAPASTANLNPDGSVGLLTWGAIFDCFEFALQQELGETPATLQALRGKLAFTDPANPTVGFSEFFPIEELGVDDFRSQTNRRVELLFFEQGEEPDVAHALSDPETSDLYLPGHFQRVPLRPLATDIKSDDPLVVSVYVGGDPSDSELVIIDGNGTEVLKIPANEADQTVQGVCFFQLEPAFLPDPFEARLRQGDHETRVVGPCSPLALQQALAGGNTTAADELAYPTTATV